MQLERWMGDAMGESIQDLSVHGKAIVSSTVAAIAVIIIAAFSAAAATRHIAKGVNNSVVLLI